jgi:hypothetical protein
MSKPVMFAKEAKRMMSKVFLSIIFVVSSFQFPLLLVRTHKTFFT